MKGLGYEGFPSSDEKTSLNKGTTSNSGSGMGGAKVKAGNVFSGARDSTSRLESGKAPKLKPGTTYG